MKVSASRMQFGRVTKFAAVSVLGLSLAATVSTAFAIDDEDVDATSFPQVERKVKNLKKRVRLLEAQVADLQTQLLPTEVIVDCAAGNTIGSALTAHAEDEGLLTIRVSGTCNEAVYIKRSNVRLIGAAGATLVTPATVNSGISILDNVGNVEIVDLTITGGSLSGVTANKGAHATLRNVIVQQAASGVMALDNSVLDVTGATIRNNTQGVYAARGGVVSVSNSIIETNNVGVLSFKAGTVILTSSTPELIGGPGTIVRGNTNGVVVRSGGFFEMADSTVEGSQFNGILADSGATVHFFSKLFGTGNRIANNLLAGVLLNKNSSVVVSDLATVITANQRGIACHATTGYVVPAGFTVTGNTIGDILNCFPN